MIAVLLLSVAGSVSAAEQTFPPPPISASAASAIAAISAAPPVLSIVPEYPATGDDRQAQPLYTLPAVNVKRHTLGLQRGIFIPEVDFLTEEDALAVLGDTQFPQECSSETTRFLLVSISEKIGLGYNMKLLAYLLATAIAENRVLLEVAAGVPRWCERPPFTLQCYYKRWTSCSTPTHPEGGRVAWHSPRTRRYNSSLERIVYVNTHGFHASGTFYGLSSSWRARPVWDAAVTRFLASPRTWVRAEADQYVLRCGLVPGRFLTVHYRDSPQKVKERGRFSLPNAAEYAAAAARLMKTGRLAPDMGIFLQTANPDGLVSFAEAWAQLREAADPEVDPGPLCFTHNRRTVNDSWGGHDGHSNITEEGAVGALNAHLSTLGGGLISPTASMWTNFLAELQPPLSFLTDTHACNKSSQLWCATRRNRI